MRALIFVTLIRGVQLFAPYQGRSGWTARPPPPGQPVRPFLRDDPDHIRQVAAALATAFLNCHKPEPGGLPEGVLDHPTAHPSPGRDFIHAPITQTVLVHLISNDAQDRQLTDRELTGQRRWHPATRAGLIEIARRLDPLVLRWDR